MIHVHEYIYVDNIYVFYLHFVCHRDFFKSDLNYMSEKFLKF